MRLLDLAGEGRRSCLLSPLLRKDAAGFVHSVFKNSCNVSVGGELLHIGSDWQPLCAFGISLPDAQARELLSRCAPGDVVTWKKERLTFYTSDVTLRVYFRDFREEDLRIPRLCLRTALRASEVYLQLARADHLARIGLDADMALRENCRLLLSGEDARETYVKAMRFFIGRGRGLTPGGDDFLLGYGAALTIFQREAVFMDALRSALCAQTTDISIAYYHALLAGCANEDFLRLVLQLPQYQPEQTAACIERVRQVGHTSGSDTLFGFFWGLQKIAGEETHRE